MITLALGVFIVGTFFGMAMGRLFCKQHHKNDAKINGGAGTREYPPGHPLGMSEDVCGPSGGCCNDGKCNC